MTKLYTAGIRLILSLIVVLNVFGELTAQTTVQIGNGTAVSPATLYSPINRINATTGNDYSQSNIVITAAELKAANVPPGAIITGIQFNKMNNGATAASALPIIFQIWMKNSLVFPTSSNITYPSLSGTTTWANIQAGHTQVYGNNNQVITSAIGWIDFPLNSNFTYTGDNLEIATYWDISALPSASTTPPVPSPTTASFQWEYTAGTENAVIGNTNSSAITSLNGNTAVYKFRPNIRITYIDPAACINPTSVTVGTTQASVSATCPEVEFLLKIDGHATGNNLAFQWQRSLNNSTWSDIAGFNTASGLISQTSDYYYRALVSCNGGPGEPTNSVFVDTYVPFSGNNYTINSAAATDYPVGTNFQTFAEFGYAISCAGVSGPVKVTVEPGTYTGRLVITSIPNVSSTDTILIEGGGQTLLHNNTVSAERAAIQLNGANYVTINNLKIDAAKGTSGWGVHFMNAADNNRISNCTIWVDSGTVSTSNYAGIVFGNSTTSATNAGTSNNNKILNNLIVGGEHGISINGTPTTGLVLNNIISGNTIRNFWQYGIVIKDNDGLKIIGNDISRPNRVSTAFFRGIGAQSTGGKNMYIANNRVHDPNTGNTANAELADGIYIASVDAPSGQENIVVNNQVYNFTGSGNQTGLYSSSADGSYFYHNTVVLDDQTANANAATTRGVYQGSASTNVEFKNNISYVTRGGSGVRVAMFFNTTTGVSLQADHNVLYVPPSTANFHIGSWGSNAAALKTTIADFRTASNTNFASTVVDPLFTNVASNNYTPSNSAVDGAIMFTSVVGGVTHDINGQARDASFPDPGAIEWIPAVTDAAISGFVVPTAVPYCDNTLPVIVTLANAGATDLQSVTINWSINGAAQTPVNLSSLGITSGGSSDIQLDIININPNVIYDIIATAANPNGGSDNNASNNSFTLTGWRRSFAGNAYTINKNIAASATNFTSLQGAVTELMKWGICGAVEVKLESGSGPYTEQVTIHNVPGLSYNDSLVFNGNGETVQFTPTTNDRHIIKLRNTRYVTVKNFVLNTQGTFGWAVHISRGATSVRVRSNAINIPLTITGSDGFGISISDSAATGGGLGTIQSTILADTVVIEGNTISGGKYGINAAGLTPSLSGDNDNIRNLYILNNALKDSYETGVYAQGIKKSVFRGNDVSRPSRSTTEGSSSSFPYSGITVVGPHYDYLIDKNKVHDIHNSNMGTAAYYVNGIKVTGNNIAGATTGYSNGVISNNIIYNINNPGTQYGIRADIRQGALCEVYHNTIVLDDATYSGTNETIAFYNDETTTITTPLSLMNNIFSISRGGTGVKKLVDFRPGTGSLNSDYNAFWFGTANGTLTYVRSGGSSYSALRDWQNIGKDINSVDADPTFINAATGNLRPTNGAVEGSGLNTTLPANVTTDITDAPRSSTPDLGAFEVDLPTVAAQPADIAVCAGTNVSFNASSASVPAPAIQWQRSTDGINWININSTTDGSVYSGFSASTLDITATPVSLNGFMYRALFTNANGFVYSAAVELLVYPATVGGTLNSDQSVCIGNTPADITLTGQVGSILKWQRSLVNDFSSGVADINITSGTLSGTSVIGILTQTTYFRAVVQSGVCAIANSTPVTLTVTSVVDNTTAVAGTVGGASVCANYDIMYSNNYMNNCNVIATVTASGASPVSGTINACVKIDATVQTAPDGVPYVQRHFDILPASSPTTATSTIRLYFTESDFTSFNANNTGFLDLPVNNADAAKANLRITQYNGTGTAPGNYTGTAVLIDPADADIVHNAAAGRWEVTFSATGSGGFYVHTTTSVLPVTGLELKGVQSNEVNRLSWRTATETNNKGFELQRSADGKNFSGIAYISTKAVNGNSTSPLNYSYDDEKPLAGNNYYRLKQTDKDGKFTYSNTVLLIRKVKDITLTGVYPNPTERELNVVITSPKQERVTIIVTDLSGKVVMQQLVQVVTGDNQKLLNVQSLAAGTYIIKAICADGCESAVHRFVKQ